MKQLTLDSSTGRFELAELVAPVVPRRGILVRSEYSLISSGTERAKVEFAAKPLWEKARQRPDQVAKVLESARKEGIVATAQKVRERLAMPQPLGYSLSGRVIAVGEECDGFAIGMPVACGGVSACHAEIVSVPRNLAVPVPEGVPLADACFATVGSVALHGIRTGRVAIGDRVLVIGLGLIGQLAVRLCAAAGAHVFGVDPRADRAQLALESGAECVETALDHSTVLQIHDWGGGRGADVVLITAGGADNQPLLLAGEGARDRARIVAIGAVELEIPRDQFYEKELDLIVSRSYGPGRYDPNFEERGFTYPPGFVPWTERRNMEEILNILASGRLSLAGLRDTSVPFERAPEAYELLKGGLGASPIAGVLEYQSETAPPAPASRPGIQVPAADALLRQTFLPTPLEICFLGMGNFASSYLLPAVKSVDGPVLTRVVTSAGLKAETAKARGGFKSCGTDALAAISAPDSRVVFIATRHDSHARYAEAALRANKAVFVEKPLALNEEELDRVAAALHAMRGRLMVGFNRRFAPATAWALHALGTNRANLRFLCRVNAGALPHNHWLLDPETGGGRLLGEGCHFIDLACFIADSPPTEINARSLDAPHYEHGHQSYRIELVFANGATAGIDYLSNGDSSLSKERIEIHRSGTSIVIDDFRSASYHRAGKRRTKRWAGRDKGHRAEVKAFLEAVRTGAQTPIPEEQSLLSTALTLAAARSLREGRPVTREEW